MFLIFSTDFSKGFDRIDHNVLIGNLQLNIHPALTNWVPAFLSNRMQAVRITGVLSGWKCPNGGIPQGTKLGVILFSVMTNELLTDWRLRTKFATLEIIPMNGNKPFRVQCYGTALSNRNFWSSQAAYPPPPPPPPPPPKCRPWLFVFEQYAQYMQYAQTWLVYSGHKQWLYGKQF
jgi:hypothetical protein